VGGRAERGEAAACCPAERPAYPLTWIGVVFPYWESLAWVALLKLGLAGLGAYLLGMALKLRRSAALLGGITFASGTYMVVWLMHPARERLRAAAVALPLR
jgi:hypothetical protein